jgi:signal transduction histidine kinase
VDGVSASVRASLVLVLAGSSAIFAMFAVVAALLSRPQVPWLLPVDAITAGAALLVAVWLGTRRLGIIGLHVVGYAVALYCAGHAAIITVLSGSPQDAFFIAFLVVGIGAIAVEPVSSILVMGVISLGATGAIATASGFYAGVGSAVAMATSALLGITILAARRRSMVQIERLRRTERERTVELAAVVAQLEQELVERQRAETQRAAMEARLQQVQSLDALGTLAGGVAHDMNNVLAAVAGVAELGMLDYPPGTPAHQDFGSVLAAAQRGTALTRNLLGFARRGKLRHAAFQLDDMVREVVQVLSRTTPERIRFVLELDRHTVAGTGTRPPCS